ncbi:hypothetical protein DMI70_11690 [Escherichia coli]|nr:hypothetical protein [Escherichia coli]
MRLLYFINDSRPLFGDPVSINLVSERLNVIKHHMTKYKEVGTVYFFNSLLSDFCTINRPE